MGMGKSLSLIALVMHTLDHARSSRARYKELHTRNGQGGILQERRLLLHQNLVLTLYQLCFHAAFHSLTWLSALYSWELELKRLAIRLREISTID